MKATRPGRVFVGYLHEDLLSATFHKSLLGLYLWDLVHEVRILDGGGYAAVLCGTGNIADGRNEITSQFLDSSAEWLFMVDADMGFAPDTVDRLIAAADPDVRPVVGGLCWAHRVAGVDPILGHPQFATFATLYRYGKLDTGEFGMVPWTREEVEAATGVEQVSATGAACLLIHRTVVEQIHAEVGPNWWTRIPNPGENGHFGEDISFCLRLGKQNIPLHVDTTVRLSHHKSCYLYTPPPATPPAHAEPEAADRPRLPTLR